MPNMSSRKLVNPLAVTAPARALDAALSMAALAADKKVDTPVRIVADRGMIIFSVANPRSGIAITATTGAAVTAAGEAATSATRLEARQVRPETVMLGRSRTILSASAPGFELITGMIAGPFPEYERTMPQAKGNASCRWRFGNEAAA
jgi:hypothetical protein